MALFQELHEQRSRLETEAPAELEQTEGHLFVNTEFQNHRANHERVVRGFRKCSPIEKAQFRMTRDIEADLSSAPSKKFEQRQAE